MQLLLQFFFTEREKTIERRFKWIATQKDPPYIHNYFVFRILATVQVFIVAYKNKIFNSQVIIEITDYLTRLNSKT